jgi:hypothetical protein
MTNRQKVLQREPSAMLELEYLTIDDCTTRVYSVRIGGMSISGGRSLGEASTARGAWRAALDCLPAPRPTRTVCNW